MAIDYGDGVDPEDIDLGVVDDEIKDLHTYPMEENAHLVKMARNKAHKMYDVAERLDHMAETARAIASLHVIAARQAANTAADLLAGEFDITVVDEEDEGPEEEQDCDE